MDGFRSRLHSWGKSLGNASFDSDKDSMRNTYKGKRSDDSFMENESFSQHASVEDEDKLPEVELLGYSAKTKNKLLTKEMCEELRQLMPTRIQLYTEWTLLYSLEQHGASLHSLYDNIKYDTNTNVRVGYILVIRDKKGGIFGGYANEPFHPTDSRRYYGNGECFLWKLEKVPDLQLHGNEKVEASGNKLHNWQLRGFPYTGINEFSIYCTSKFLSMGAGDGHYGLWIDDGLFKGVTSPSLTFGNDVLSREGSKFHIIGLEVWRVGR